MRYTSDLTDAQWQLIHYCFPKPAKTGRPRQHTYRELLNAMFYVVRTGCQWRNLPTDFGFAMVVHPQEPDTIFTFPIGAGESRYPPGAKARVWRSRDAGDTWQPLGGGESGLPDHFYVGVMRDAMCAEDAGPDAGAGIYFGARNGAVWGSADAGESWRQLVSDLPDVMVVRASQV